MDDLYLGIDLGTSATKAVLVESGGRVVARSSAAHGDTRRLGLGRVDPVPWVRSLTEACAALGPDTARVTAVSMAVHSPVTLFLDSTGSPLAPGISWEHPQMAAECVRMGELRAADEAVLVGNRTLPATTMALAWRIFVGESPGLAENCASFGLVGTWLGQLLTGRAALDPTQASYLGLMASTDGSNRWLGDLAERYGVPSHLLPEVLPSLTELGTLSDTASSLLGVPAGARVAVGSADTASAAYLLRLTEGGAPLYTVGTTHVITTCSQIPDPAPIAIARSHVIPGHWLSHGASNGGDALALGAHLLGYGTDRDAVQRMTQFAGQAQPQDVENAPIFIPHVTAERGPLWLDTPRTALIGLLPGTNPHAAAWAVIEGTAFATRLILEICTAEKLDEKTPVVLAGNFGTHSAFPQIVADILARPLKLINESHLPALGAAAMAATITHDETMSLPSTHHISPRPEWQSTIIRRWDRFAQQWSAIVGRPFDAPIAEMPLRGVP